MEHAAGHESSLSSYLRVLKRRWLLIALCTVLVPVAAYFFSARQEAIYQSSAQVFINKQDIGSAITGIENQTLFVDEDRAAETQVNLASVPDVAERALKIAGVTTMTADDLLAESSVGSVGLSDVLEFTVTDPDPALAEKLAGAYALAFTEYRGELDTAAVRTARVEVDKKLAQLEADGKKGTALYDNLLESEQQLATLETLKTSRAKVVRGAEEAYQIAPTPVRNAVLGLMLGLVLGVGLAFLVDALDTRVRDPAEIGQRLDLPLLGRIPPPPKSLEKTSSLAMVAAPRDPAAEAFRVLRTNLDFARLGGEDVRTVMVTSSVEGEGKSTTACNLAVALTRSGKRTCLVDLDLRRPDVARLLKLWQPRGVTDVALGHESLDAALIRIDLGTGTALAAAPANGHDEETGVLDVLVSGPLPPDPGEFVGTQRLADILAQLRERYDMVIVDSPPILRVGDSMTLSSRMDGVIVVTRLNTVTRPMLGELQRMLESMPTTKLGYVVTGSARQTGYSTGYGEGYGYGYGDPEKMEAERAALRATDAAREAEPV